MVKLKCHWCGYEFETTIIGGTQEVLRNQVQCKKCFRFIPSSIKDPTENTTGRKHIHIDYK